MVKLFFGSVWLGHGCEVVVVVSYEKNVLWAMSSKKGKSHLVEAAKSTKS